MNNIKLNHRLITILKTLIRLPIEVSGQFQIDKTFEIDTIGMFLSRCTGTTFYPTGKLLFHTHPYAKHKQPPSNGDFFGTIKNYIKYNKDPYEFIFTQEGIYVYALADEFKDSLTNNIIIPKQNDGINTIDIDIRELDDMFGNWMNDLVHVYDLFVSNKIDINEYIKVIESLGMILKFYTWNEPINKKIEIKSELSFDELTNNYHDILDWSTSGGNNVMDNRIDHIYNHVRNQNIADIHKGLLPEYLKDV